MLTPALTPTNSAPIDWAALHRAHVAELTRRYEPVLARHGYDALVIHSGSPKLRTQFDDNYWPLRPTPAFQHWLPLVEADSALLLVCGKRPRLIWTQPKSYWESPRTAESDFWAAQLEIVIVEEAADVRAHLHPSGKLAFFGEETRRAESWGIGDLNPPGLIEALDQLRVHKTAYELAALDEANRIAARGHRAVAEAFFHDDHSELDLHLLYLSKTLQDDGETPYKNIFALGQNAATLHHVQYQKRAHTRPAESLLVDAGATCQGYCSDITRTYTKGHGAVADAFAKLVEGTEAMQRRLCASASVGKPYEALHDEAHVEVAKILCDLGIAKVGADEVVASGVSRLFFPHGLGHSLGLVCHDVGCAELRPRADNPFLRNTSTIGVDQVFTIEPGIYFIDMLLAPLRQGPHAGRVDWKTVDALAPLGGVRIEDDVQVRAGGVHNFTRTYLP